MTQATMLFRCAAVLPAAMCLTAHAHPVVLDGGDSGRNEWTGARGATVDEARTAVGEPMDTSEWLIREAKAAIERAVAIVGLEELKDSQVHAALVVLKEENTPYLSEQLINRPLWRVTVKDWSVNVPALEKGLADQFRRTLDMYIDPVDGKLLKLETRWPEGEPRLMRTHPDAETTVTNMRHGGNEVYHGFPSEPPKVSFLEALDSAVERGGAQPNKARQIFGHYIIQSRGLDNRRPVWAITLWGIPPYHLLGRAETNDPVFSVRYVVDANTGKCLFHVNTP